MAYDESEIRTRQKRIVTPEEPQGVKPPSNCIVGRPKAALLFWFFSDFRCGVPVFIVILVIYKYKNR